MTFPVGDILTEDPKLETGDLRKNTPPAMSQQITGFGALMREAGRPWRCLNLASANVDGIELSQGVLVPMPLHHRNELASSFVTYNNQPLMAKSPAVKLASRFQLQGVKPAVPNPLPDAPERFLHYEYPLPDSDKHYRGWGKLPELKFQAGKECYGALLFTVSNAGALPPGLADPADPTRLDSDALLPPPANAQNESPWSQVQRSFSYQRKVPIGGIRVEQPATTRSPGQAPVLGVGAVAQIHLPVVPDDVLPRAREIERPQVDRPGATPLRDRTVPLLLLDPWADGSAGSQLPKFFCFSVRKPAIDLDTWERWVSIERTPEMRTTRQLVWAAVHRQAAIGQDRVPLEDPAVSGLFFELCRVEPDAKRAFVDFRFVALPAPSRAEPFEALESLVAPAITVRCEIAPADNGTIDTASTEPKEIVVRVPQGQVFELRVHAVIDATASERLAPGVRKLDSGSLATPEALKAARRSAGDGAKLFSPFRLLIEVATDALPAPDQLFAAFKTHFDSDASSLVAELPADGDFFLHLGRAELLRQVWRWNGRNIAPFRFPPAADRHRQSALAAKLQLWEVEGFGERPDDDHLVVDFPRLVSPATGSQKQHPVFRYGENLAGDLRAHYYRFAVRAYSRYEGILRRHPGAVFRSANVVVSPRRSFVESLSSWHRCVVPCRRGQPVPKPGIRLVLPLTEAPGAAAETWESRSPGLLVVLDEPWFEVGGLAERLVAEVVTAKHSRESNCCDEQVLEMGPDPTLSGEPARYDRDRETPEKIHDLIGPVGHTSDTSATAPLFVHSSFICRRRKGCSRTSTGTSSR